VWFKGPSPQSLKLSTPETYDCHAAFTLTEAATGPSDTTRAKFSSDANNEAIDNTFTGDILFLS